MDFAVGQFGKELGTISPYQEGAIKQEYNRTTEKLL